MAEEVIVKPAVVMSFGVLADALGLEPLLLFWALMGAVGAATRRDDMAPFELRGSIGEIFKILTATFLSAILAGAIHELWFPETTKLVRGALAGTLGGLFEYGLRRAIEVTKRGRLPGVPAEMQPGVADDDPT